MKKEDEKRLIKQNIKEDIVTSRLNALMMDDEDHHDDDNDEDDYDNNDHDADDTYQRFPGEPSLPGLQDLL